jgi:predicted ATPase
MDTSKAPPAAAIAAAFTDTVVQPPPRRLFAIDAPAPARITRTVDAAAGGTASLTVSPSHRAGPVTWEISCQEDHDGDKNRDPWRNGQHLLPKDPPRLQIPEHPAHVSSELFASWAFVGRNTEQETIRSAYRRVEASNRCSTSVSSSAALPTSFQPPPPMCELVLVEGQSGVGKTCLVRQALRDVVEPDSPSSSGYLCAGRFDSTPRPEPQAAIVDALRELAASVLLRDDDEVARVGRCLSGALGRDRDALVQMVPLLHEIFQKADEAMDVEESSPAAGDNPTAMTTSQHDDGSVSSSTLAGLMSRTDLNRNRGASGAHMNKFKDVVRRLLRAVASSSDHPLVLLLDDVQWADEASLDFVWSLLASDNGNGEENNPGLLVIATYRVGDDDDSGSGDKSRSNNNTGDGESRSDPTARVWSKLQQEKNRVNVELVKLQNLGQVDVEALLVELLGHGEACMEHMTEETTTAELPPRTAPISGLSSLLYGCTRGNPLLLRENFLHLRDLGLFSYNGAASRWEWDPEEVRVELVPTLSKVVRQRLLSLPHDVLETLKVASCLGTCFDEELLNRLMTVPVLPCLCLAAERGLVNPDILLRRWMFAHNQAKASAYELIPIDERKTLHSRLGRKLWGGLRPDEVERYIFPVIGQFLMGDKTFASLRERKEIALLFARAGERAIAMSSFQSAYTFLSAAIDCLGDSRWRESYTLSLNLHNAAAEVACCIGLHANAEALVSEVIKHARSRDDTYRAQSTHIYALGGQNLLLEAISAGVNILKTLGVSFPPNPTRMYIWREFMLLKWTLRRKYDRILACGPGPGTTARGSGTGVPTCLDLLVCA